MLKGKFNAINTIDSNLKELLSGSFISFIYRMLGMILSYVVLLVVSNKFGSEGTGIYTMAFNILNSLAIFGTLGTNISILRYSGEFNTANKRVELKKLFYYSFKFSLLFSLFIGVVLYYASDFIATHLFKNETYSIVLKVISFTIPIYSLSQINIEFLRGLKKLKLSEYFRGPSNYWVIIILIFLIFNSRIVDSIYALLIAVSITFILCLAYNLNYLRKIKLNSFSTDTGFNEKTLLKTSLPLFVVSTSTFVLSISGSFILEMYCSTSEVGIFNICFKIAQFVSIVLLLVNTISAPKFSELFWQKKTKELQKLLDYSAKMIFYGSVVISIGLIIFSDKILAFFGDEFISGTPILLILILSQIVNSITGSIGVFLSMTGNEKILRNILVFSTIFVLLAHAVVIPRYGVTGAAINIFIGTFLINVPAVIYAKRKLKYITYYRPFRFGNEKS